MPSDSFSNFSFVSEYSDSDSDGEHPTSGHAQAPHGSHSALNDMPTASTVRPPPTGTPGSLSSRQSLDRERTRSLTDPFIYDTPKGDASRQLEPEEPELLKESGQGLPKRGVYQLRNAASGKAVDLAGVQADMIIGYSAHEDENQQWELLPLGPGYAIRSVYNGSYISLPVPATTPLLSTIPSAYPVSWEIQEYVDSDRERMGEPATYRIRWPGSIFVLELDDTAEGLKKINLAEQKHHPDPAQLWSFTLLRGSSVAPQASVALPSSEPYMKMPEPQFARSTRSVNARGEEVVTTTTTTTVISTTTRQL